MTVDRLAAVDRCRRKLGALAAQAEWDPLVMVDLALSLIGAANREACDGRCSERDWIEANLYIAEALIGSVAAWSGTGWREALQMVVVRLDLREFEQVVVDGIWALPEVDG